MSLIFIFMTFLVKVIRDHYMVYCDCLNKRFDQMIYLNSCGIIKEGVIKNAICHSCKLIYNFDELDKKLAKESYDFFMSKLEKGN